MSQKKSRNIDIKNQKLYNNLIEWRNNTAYEKNVQFNQIINDNTLLNVAQSLPKNFDELCETKNFGIKKAKKYSVDILKIIENYCQQEQIDFNEQEIENAKIKSLKSSDYTLYLLNQKKFSPKKIAKIRKLKVASVFFHFALAIEKNKLKAKDILPPEIIQEMENILLSTHRELKRSEICTILKGKFPDHYITVYAAEGSFPRKNDNLSVDDKEKKS